MKYTHDEYLFTRDHRTPEEIGKQRREAIIGWIFLIGITTVLLLGAKLLTG